jgi:hypothetical protein
LGYANATIPLATATPQTVDRLIDELTKRIDNLAAAVRTPTTTTTHKHTNNSGNAYKGKTKDRQPKKRFEDFNLNEDYCWTHGLIGHSGKQCLRRYQNHNEDATYFNRMGGNNKNCRDT